MSTDNPDVEAGGVLNFPNVSFVAGIVNTQTIASTRWNERLNDLGQELSLHNVENVILCYQKVNILFWTELTSYAKF